MRRPAGCFNPELPGVLRVQPLPTAEFQRVGADDAADGSPAEKLIKNIETDVPSGSTHRDEAAIDVVPQGEAGAATNSLELPADILVPPVVLEHVWSLGS